MVIPVIIPDFPVDVAFLITCLLACVLLYALKEWCQMPATCTHSIGIVLLIKGSF